MKKAVATLAFTGFMILSACNNVATTTSPKASLSEAEIKAQITADYTLPTNYGAGMVPDISLLEKDGDTTYYQANPDGMGGYILYSGAINLYSYQDGSETVQSVKTGSSYITDISLNNQYAVGFIEADGPQGSKIGARVTDLQSGDVQDYLVDMNIITQQAGAGAFSPDSTKLAFAVTDADPDQEAKDDTTVYIVDLQTGEMRNFLETHGVVKLNWDNNSTPTVTY